MFEEPGIWNIDEQLRVLELAQTGLRGGDLVMLVENSGTPVNGESARRFPDGKPRLDISGYSWGMIVRQRVGSGAESGRTYQPLVVVRQLDAATASLASLAYNRSLLKVCISAFRAGGDPSAADTQPMFEIELQDAQLTGQFLTSGGPLSTLAEILVFSYRRITQRSAPQQASGARGAVRECEMTPGGAS